VGSYTPAKPHDFKLDKVLLILQKYTKHGIVKIGFAKKNGGCTPTSVYIVLLFIF